LLKTNKLSRLYSRVDYIYFRTVNRVTVRLWQPMGSDSNPHVMWDIGLDIGKLQRQLMLLTKLSSALYAIASDVHKITSLGNMLMGPDSNPHVMWDIGLGRLADII